MVADRIAKQQLNVIILVDTSKSMQGERIAQVNKALREIREHLVDMQDENTNVNFSITVIPFSNDASFLNGDRQKEIERFNFRDLKGGGWSNLHCAYDKLSELLIKESKGGIMPDFGGIAPIILLLTDGHPTKATEKQLEELKRLPWFRAALRYGIAIELNDERTMRVLTDFTDDRDCVVECINAETLAKIIQIIVLTASKVKSQSSAVRANNTAKANIKKGAEQTPAPKQTSHTLVKQQVKVTLEEVDDWEW